MVTIDFLESTSAQIFESLRRELLLDGVVILSNFQSRDNSSLLIQLANHLGKATTVGIRVPENNLERNLIHQINSRTIPVRDKYGFIIQSTTNNPFFCHTDDYFSPNPVDIVIFHCLVQSRFGGETKICYLKDLLKILPPTLLKELKKKQFPVHFGTTALIESNKKVTTIRYNRLEIERAEIVTNKELDKKQLELLNQLDRCITDCETIFKLGKYDCIIINNKTVLHGRLDFPKSSSRLLKRLRLHYA
jgi:alpha-ketoglutarate-dependent taurine dioxygenase